MINEDNFCLWYGSLSGIMTMDCCEDDPVNYLPTSLIVGIIYDNEHFYCPNCGRKIKIINTKIYNYIEYCSYNDNKPEYPSNIFYCEKFNMYVENNECKVCSSFKFSNEKVKEYIGFVPVFVGTEHEGK